MDSNPCREIKPLREAKEGSRPWSPEDYTLAMQHATQAMCDAISLGRYTGQRLGDIIRMSKSDLENDGIWVEQEKTGKRLWIPIHRDLKGLIDRLSARSAERFVNFTKEQWHTMWRSHTRPGKPMHAIARDGKSFHGLRKLAAVALKEAGCEIAHIQAITGQSPQMVEHYTKEINQKRMAREAMDRLENNPQ